MLQVRDVAKSFGGRQVLHGASLDVAAGELVLLRGPSGIGKTTLLRIIAGLELPDVGSVTIGGEVVSAPGVYMPPARRGVGMVFQHFALWPHLTGERHLRFVLDAHGVPRAQQHDLIARMLALVELEDKARALPGQLSGGQQQRLDIARALIVPPRVLLLDEPFAHLDDALRERLTAAIVQLMRQHGMAVVAATHDVDGLSRHAAGVYDCATFQ